MKIMFLLQIMVMLESSFRRHSIPLVVANHQNFSFNHITCFRGTILPPEYSPVSFDVCVLFIGVPKIEAIDFVEDRLDQDPPLLDRMIGCIGDELH